MKQKFSKSWKGSKQKRKQIKYRKNAPLHLKRKLLSASLNKELRKRYSRRSIPLRKGDAVKIISGKFKGKTGKVDSLNMKLSKVYVEGIQTTKQDGNKINLPLDPSNLQIEELNLTDKKRGVAKEKTDQKAEIKEKNIKQNKPKSKK